MLVSLVCSKTQRMQLLFCFASYLHMPGLEGVSARSTAGRAAAVVKSSSGFTGFDPTLSTVLHAMHLTPLMLLCF